MGSRHAKAAKRVRFQGLFAARPDGEHTMD